METKSSIKRAPKKVAILHNCTEKETLNRLSQLLVGNGNPEAGYVYKVIKMGDEVKDINKKLTGICGIVTELHEESVGKKASGKTNADIKAEKRARITMWIKTLSFVVGAVGLMLTAYYSHKSSTVPEQLIETEHVLKKRIDSQEGVSKVTRGGYVKYNDGGLSDSTKVR